MAKECGEWVSFPANNKAISDSASVLVYFIIKTDWLTAVNVCRIFCCENSCGAAINERCTRDGWMNITSYIHGCYLSQRNCGSFCAELLRAVTICIHRCAEQIVLQFWEGIHGSVLQISYLPFRRKQIWRSRPWFCGAVLLSYLPSMFWPLLLLYFCWFDPFFQPLVPCVLFLKVQNYFFLQQGL